MATQFHKTSVLALAAILLILLAFLAGSKFGLVSSPPPNPQITHAASSEPGGNPLAGPPATAPASFPASTSAIETPAPAPLHFAAGPNGGSAMALDAAGPRGRRSAGPGNVLDVHPPLAVYTFRIGDPGGLSSASPNGGFIYYINDAGKQAGTVTVLQDAPSGSARVLRPIAPHTIDLAKSLDRLATLPQVAAGSFELRELILRFQVINKSPYYVLWLKSDAGPQGDFLFCFDAFPRSQVQPLTLYKPDALFALMLSATPTGAQRPDAVPATTASSSAPH